MVASLWWWLLPWGLLSTRLVVRASSLASLDVKTRQVCHRDWHVRERSINDRVFVDVVVIVVVIVGVQIIEGVMIVVVVVEVVVSITAVFKVMVHIVLIIVVSRIVVVVLMTEVQAEVVLIRVHLVLPIIVPVVLLRLLLLLQALLLILEFPHLLLLPGDLLLDLDLLAHVLSMHVGVSLVRGTRSCRFSKVCQVVVDVSVDVDGMRIEFVHVLLRFALHLCLLLLLFVLLLLETLLLLDLPFPLFLLELILGMLQLVAVIGGHVIVMVVVWDHLRGRVRMCSRGIVVDVDRFWGTWRHRVRLGRLHRVMGISVVYISVMCIGMVDIDMRGIWVIVWVVVVPNVCMGIHNVSHLSGRWARLIVHWHDDPGSIAVLSTIAPLMPSLLGLNSYHYA